MQLYLDSAATTYVDEEVKEDYFNILNNYYASTGSLHEPGVKTLQMESEAKMKIASLLKVKPSEIFFDSGATEGNNYAIKGVAFNYKNRGNTIITSKVEHPSVLETCKQLEKDFNFNVIYLDVDENGQIDLEKFKKALSNDVILVSIMYVNHEVGTIMPIKEIRNIINKYPKIIFHSDITQAIGKVKVDMSLLDLATMSGHKIHAIKGSGFIYKKEKVTLFPIINGHPANNALRAGTSNFPANIVLAKALAKSLTNLNENFLKWKECQKKLINRLQAIEGIVVNTNPEFCIPGIVNFSCLDYNVEVLIRTLSTKGIYVSSRSVCSVAIKDHTSATLKAMGKNEKICVSSIRVSYDNVLDDEQINYFINSLIDTLKNTKKVG